MKIASVLFIAACAAAYPASYVYSPQYPQLTRRLRSGPQAGAMMLGSYYRPQFARQTYYEPETAMTAFVSGDRVASGTYMSNQNAPNCMSCIDQQEIENDPTFGQYPEYEPVLPAVEQAPSGTLPPASVPANKPYEGAVIPLEPLPVYAESSTPNEILSVEVTDSSTALPVQPTAAQPTEAASIPVAQTTFIPAVLTEIAAKDPEQSLSNSGSKKTSNKPSKKGKKRPVVYDEEDEANEEDEEPNFVRRPFSAYFPMFFGAYPGARAQGGAAGVTAIANSYSTGRGGVATSHATAYGGGAKSDRS